MPAPNPVYVPRVHTYCRGPVIYVNSCLTKAGMVQLCKDMETFAGPGNRFLPGVRCLRWVSWAKPSWNRPRLERILRGGPMQCKELRFVREKPKANRVKHKNQHDMKPPDWPEDEMPCDDDICEAWKNKETDVLLQPGVYHTQLVALDEAPHWTYDEICMLRDALFFLDCVISPGRPVVQQLRYRMPRMLVDAGIAPC